MKIFKDKKKKRMLLLLLSLFSVVVMTITVTYAFFNYLGMGETTNIIETGSVVFHYDELTSRGRGITIEDALPVSDNELEKESSRYFEFKITSQTMSKVEIPYVVTARMSSDSDSILGDVTNIYLSEVSGNKEEATNLFKNDLPVYNDLEQYSNITKYVEKIIYEAKVPEKTVNYDKTFRLRMWIDEDADFSNGEYNDKKFTITVNVYANGEKVNSEEDEFENLAPGMYDLDNNLVYTWNELKEKGIIFIDEYSGSFGVTSEEPLRDVPEYYKLVIADGINQISGYSFSNYSSSGLVEVVIPDSVTSIGSYAFNGCEDLENIVFGNGLREIGDGVFTGTKLTEVTIPEGVVSIGRESFYNYNKLKNVVLPASLVTIGESAFDSYALESIEISPNSQYYSSVDGVLFNKDKTKLIKYPIAKSGTSYTIPSSVTVIGNHAFHNALNLTSVVIPNSVTTIEERAFSDCAALDSIIIPDSVTSIGDSAFMTCESLTNLSIGNNVAEIGKNAFFGCTSLTSVTIPSSVTIIGPMAFYVCTNLESVAFENTTGWFDTYNVNSTTSSKFLDVTNPITNATNLKKASSAYWKRIN